MLLLNKKGRNMPAKTTKKTTVKKPVAKKATVKKAATKKVVAEEVKEFVPETHECACGHECKCGCHGGCGSKFGRFLKKLIIALVIFALGFAAAKMCDHGRYYRAARVDFNNGCLDVASVKCPALAEKLPLMDINKDGCISKEEYKMFKKDCPRARRAMNEAKREVREELREARQEVREEMREVRQALAD